MVWLLVDYYEERSWYKQIGIPTANKLKQLGLGSLTSDVEKEV